MQDFNFFPGAFVKGSKNFRNTMVHLFLSEPTWNDDGDVGSTKMRTSLLNKLESVMCSFVMSGCRSEARLWLCDTVASMCSITCHHQCELFMNFLTSKPRRYDLASQLLQMIFEKRPQKAGSILAKKSFVLKEFFEGNPKRVLQWFGSSIGGLQYGKGAKALSQFAFINRDICWEELEWKGKHGQSPAIVATKPHYFLDLDIEQTIENFLENVPEFWSSAEFGESLKDGEILFTDTKFFLEYFVDLMYKEDSRDVWELITEFLKEEPFSYLCHHLLITLEERDLCKFINQLRKLLSPGIHSKEAKDFSNSFLFEVLLSKFSDCGSFDQLLLVDAVLNKRRELLKLLREEGNEEAQAEIKNIVSQICNITENENVLAPIIKDCNRRRTIEAMKLLVLQSWVLYYIMSEECRTQESWESLFMKNAIGFRKSDNYALLNHDELSEEYGSDLDHRVKNKAKRKKKGISRKKRRRHFDGDGVCDDEFLDFSITNNGLGLHSDVGSWFLATDGYSASWSSVDLPEYLSRHCLSTWMAWVFAGWDE